MMNRIKSLSILICAAIALLISPNAKAQIVTATLESTLNLVEIGGIKIPYQNGIPLPSFEKQKRNSLNLGGNWLKQRFSANDEISLSKRDASGYANLINEAGERYKKDFDDSAWDAKQIPGVENKINSYPIVPEIYQDGVWYRKHFTIDNSFANKNIKLIFYAVNYVADIWLNGEYLGYHEGGYSSFAFDVSDKLIDGENVIAVRVDNPAWDTRSDIVPYKIVDWFNYTGIIHDVYLEVSDPISVVRADVVPRDLNGNIQTTIVLQNKNSIDENIDVKVEVFEADINPFNIKTETSADLIGSQAALEGTSEFSETILHDSISVSRVNLKISNPKLWSTINPNLYVMKISVLQNGEVKDEYCTQIGIRTIEKSSAKVLLNGKPVFLTGVARHEDHPIFGRSIPIDTIYTDLLHVQRVNANMLRTAHYQNHPFTYLAADRLGIVIVEEIPVWQFDLDARGQMAWDHQNNFRHIHEMMFREMVFRDYNRPSICFWSTINECQDITNRKVFIQRVHEDLDNNYPDGRFVIESAAADRPGYWDSSQDLCDVSAWTMYFGIFHGSTYYQGTKDFLEKAHNYRSAKPILATEYGYWSGENMAQNGYNAQVNMFNETFRAFKEKATMNDDGSLNESGYVFGITWWCVFDWYRHQLSQGFQSMGLMQMRRNVIKPVGNSLTEAYLPFYSRGGFTGIDENREEILNTSYSLEQNYPNPFNPSTLIKYNLPENGFVTLKIYNILGREIKSLVNEFQNAGSHEYLFNAGNLSSGVYFYSIITGNYSSTKKMMLIK